MPVQGMLKAYARNVQGMFMTCAMHVYGIFKAILNPMIEWTNDQFF